MEEDLIPIIGLEIHTELLTQTKMFCGCKNAPFFAQPNENICPICTGQPGVLPAPNGEAILKAYLVGKALGAKLSSYSNFDRKHYFYPDLPKGYQISQYELPFCKEAYLEVAGRRIEIERIHLEEDTGKLLHDERKGISLLDLNRAGVPLLELVTAPVITSAREAREFCETYQQLLRDLKVANADMEKGEMRCEANISVQKREAFVIVDFKVKPKKGFSLNPKVEVKNLNSFRIVEKAIEYEIERQRELIRKGEKIVQETRGWDERLKKTVPQREKESAQDYRYFPEPDIPPVSELNFASLQVPLLTKELFTKLKELGLTEEQARLISKKREIASSVIEILSARKVNPRILANLYINHLKLENLLPPLEVAQIASLLEERKLSSALVNSLIDKALSTKKTIKELFGEFSTPLEPQDLNLIIKEVICNSADVVASYKRGKKEAIGVLIGQVLKKSAGKLVNPSLVKELLEKELQKNS